MKKLLLILILLLIMTTCSCVANENDESLCKGFENVYQATPSLVIPCQRSYIIYSGLMAYSSDAQDIQKIVDFNPYSYGICCMNGWLYYYDLGAPNSSYPTRISGWYRIKLDNSVREFIITDYNIALERDGSVYSIYKTLNKVNPDTGKVQVLANDVGLARRIRIDDNNIFWVEEEVTNSSYTLMSFDKTSGQVKILADNLSSYYSLALYDQWIYYEKEECIYRINKDGTDETLIYGEDPIGVFDVNKYGIFLTNQGEDEDVSFKDIYTLDLDGRNKRLLTEGHLLRLQVVDQKLFFTLYAENDEQEGFYIMDIDGSNRQRITQNYTPVSWQ